MPRSTRTTNLSVLEGHTSRIEALALTPDGKRLVSASADATLRLWDLQSGRTLHTLEGHGAGVWSVAGTPDGTRAVSASFDATVRLWDLDSGSTLHVLKGHETEVYSVAVTPDGCGRSPRPPTSRCGYGISRQGARCTRSADTRAGAVRRPVRCRGVTDRCGGQWPGGCWRRLRRRTCRRKRAASVAHRGLPVDVTGPCRGVVVVQRGQDLVVDSPLVVTRPPCLRQFEVRHDAFA